MMNNMFTKYGTFVVLLFALATHQGYAWNSLFTGGHHAGKTENRYHK